MWFKGIQCFPEALLLLSVGGGVTLRGREINIYRGREQGWECASDTERDETEREGASDEGMREGERDERAVSLYHPPACLPLALFLFFYMCFPFFSLCPSVLLVFPLPLYNTAAPVASSMKWSNRSPCRRWPLLISPFKQWHTQTVIPFFCLTIAVFFLLLLLSW